MAYEYKNANLTDYVSVKINNDNKQGGRMSQSALQVYGKNFLGKSPSWYKYTILAF